MSTQCTPAVVAISVVREFDNFAAREEFFGNLSENACEGRAAAPSGFSATVGPFVVSVDGEVFAMQFAAALGHPRVFSGLLAF